MIISRAPNSNAVGADAPVRKPSISACAKAVFLDRDGIINVEKNYAHDPADFEFIEGIFDLCRNAQDQGYLIIIVTNQAGIARGFYTEHDFVTLTGWMGKHFAEQRVDIASVYYCPFHPDKGAGEYLRNSDWRKPGPGMILRAALDFNLELRDCILVGDNETDVLAGIRAGVGLNVLVDANGEASGRQTKADVLLGSTAEVATWLRQRGSA